MTTGQILLAIITGLAVNECCDVSPWVARKLVRWSARRRYTSSSRAEVRAEEQAAYIDARPGKLFKLITALVYVVAAVVAVVTRKVTAAVESPIPLWQPATLTVPVHYQDSESRDHLGYPKGRAMDQAWCQLIDEVRNAVKEVSVGSGSWHYCISVRCCIKKLPRLTGDKRWKQVTKNVSPRKNQTKQGLERKFLGC